MTARQTNNSLAAALSFNEVSSALVSSTASGQTSFLASSQPGEPVVVSSPLVSAAASANPLLAASTVALLPDLVSLLNQAVQAAVQASQRPPDPAITPFLAAGTGFQPSISSSSTPGRPIPLVVPSFVSTFTAPVLAIVSSSGHTLKCL